MALTAVVLVRVVLVTTVASQTLATVAGYVIAA